MDGQKPLRVENEAEAQARREFVRKIGYKLP
jgi:adenosine/AMP kinase